MLKLGQGLDPKEYVKRTKEGPKCLDQIILAQCDEVKQKYCIYELSKEVKGGKKIEKYVQIRVKSIEFLNKPAIAVYFYNMTDHVLSIKLNNKLRREQQKNFAASVSHDMVSDEFYSPLSSSLILMESLLTNIFVDS